MNHKTLAVTVLSSYLWLPGCYSVVAMVFLVLKLAHPQISMLFWSPDVAIGVLIVHHMIWAIINAQRKRHMIIFTWQSLILRAVYFIMVSLFLLLDCFVFQTAPKLQASKMESSMRHTVARSWSQNLSFVKVCVYVLCLPKKHLRGRRCSQWELGAKQFSHARSKVN